MSSDPPRKRPTRQEREEQAAARRRKRGRGRPGEDPQGNMGVPSLGVDGPFGLLWADPREVAPAGPRRGGRGRSGGGLLTRDEIVRAALQIAATDGAEAISMRRIASELGVGTMSLYHHVPTKDDLLDLMQDVVMGELVIPDDELPGNWRDALAAISRRTYLVYRRHQWMVSGVWERPQMGPRAFAHIEQSLGIFAGLDLGVQEIGEILGAADDYVIGFVTRQVATERALRRSGLSMEAYQQALEPYVQRLVAQGDYPNLRRFVAEAGQAEDEPRFERGLAFMLDGVAAALERRDPSGA
ncbi:hypothetical protein DSM104299_01591 [Baekduia alba]|uniref:TetR/AcrR family transcriptional regulator n=1 Tax=Baekduia alba TaxID=2997333 RepID=UPI0023415D5A|nr:TetR/AcrR family transcriptional regulator [Baekduia alba]WCB92891.1 hypothetical protein DSM104299_01591 [Baekduia alba]